MLVTNRKSIVLQGDHSSNLQQQQSVKYYDVREEVDLSAGQSVLATIDSVQQETVIDEIQKII